MKNIKSLKYLLGIALSALAIVPTSIAMVSCGASTINTTTAKIKTINVDSTHSICTPATLELHKRELQEYIINHQSELFNNLPNVLIADDVVIGTIQVISPKATTVSVEITLKNVFNNNQIADKTFIFTIHGLTPQIEDQKIENLKQALLGITIDNYQEYFDGANFLQDTKNSGRMTISKLSQLMDIEENKLESVTFKKAKTESENGMLNVDINIDLAENILYNNENIISLTDVPTGMFDPNSNFNTRTLFWIRGYNYTWFSLNIDNVNNYIENVSNKLYVPASVDRITNSENSIGVGIDALISPIELIFKYSSVASVFDNPSLWRGVNNVSVLDFSYTNVNINASINTNMFRDMRDLTTIKFNNNNAITGIPGQMVEWSSSLKLVDFSNCEKLNTINWNSFRNCQNLSVANFSNSPITNINSNAFANCSKLVELDFSCATLQNVDATAFSGCSGLKTIYVKDEPSQQLLTQNLNNVGLTEVKVIIK